MESDYYGRTVLQCMNTNIAIDTGACPIAYIQLPQSVVRNLFCPSIKDLSFIIAIIRFFSFFLSPPLSFFLFAPSFFNRDGARLERSENITTGDNAVEMKGSRAQIRHVTGGDERHIVVRGQGCNHFLETDFSGFPVGPPHCGLFGTADCFLHAVCWDLCDPMPVTSCTLAFTLVHGGVYRESVLVVLWIQVEGMMERLVRIYSLGGMFGYEKEK